MLRAVNVAKSYRRHVDQVKVLNGVDLELQTGEFVSILGNSGSGKSTLLHVLGTLDAPDHGTIEFDGRRIDNLPNAERNTLRNKTFGFIFQFFHLLPELSTLENVLTPAMIGSSVFGWWRTKADWVKRGTELLDRVGLGHRLRHKPSELSGGEMQRTAIARALITRPRILFADEPTGNLDTEAGFAIVRLLRELNREEKVTIVMVTHNREVVALTDRSLTLQRGRILATDKPAGVSIATPHLSICA